MHLFGPLLLLICLQSQALAASHLPTYDVEVVIFAYPEGSSDEARKMPSLPDLSRAVPLFRKGITVAEKRRLNETWQRLSEMAGYRPLLHLAWRQSLPDKTRGAPFRIEYPEHGQIREGPRLTGTLSLGREKYAVLKVDLVLQEHGRTYRMRKTGLMKRNEVHYLDHPMLGIFATLTKVH